MRTKTTKILTAVMLSAMLPFMTGCFGSIDELDKFIFQLAANYSATFTDDVVPDSNIELVNLNEYETYVENKEKLSEAKPYQFGWWVERVIPTVNVDGNPDNNVDVNEIVFESVVFNILFPDPLDQSEPDFDNVFELARFDNARVGDFMLEPQVYEIDDVLAQRLSALLLIYDKYFIQTSFSETTAPGPNPPQRFEIIEVKGDIVARMQGELEL